MNITVISLWDYAGAGQHIANAVNRVGRHQASFIRQGVKPKEPASNEQVATVADADIIHIKGDEPLWKFDKIMATAYGVNSFHDFGKPLILSVEGSTFRRRIYNLADYAETPLTALTADLALPEYNALYTPQGIDSESLPNIWQMGDPPFISHSPSNRATKGTALLLEAMPYFDIDIIEGVPLAECIQRKATSTLFFDQCLTGYYGYAALEAGAMGIPFAAWLPDYAIEQAGGLLDDHPVINCGQSPEWIRRTLLDALEGDMAELSKRTKAFIDRVHSYSVVGNMWSNIYEGLV